MNLTTRFTFQLDPNICVLYHYSESMIVQISMERLTNHHRAVPQPLYSYQHHICVKKKPCRRKLIWPSLPFHAGSNILLVTVHHVSSSD